jgi:hypothetical protein
MSDLQILTTIGEDQALVWADGWLPPRRDQYSSDKAFLEDATSFWRDFTAAMRADGIDDASLLLAGCLPDAWQASEDERCAVYTAADWEKSA